MKKLSKKTIGILINQAYNRYFTGVQVDIFDLCKVHREIDSIIFGLDEPDIQHDKMLALVEKFRFTSSGLCPMEIE